MAGATSLRAAAAPPGRPGRRPTWPATTPVMVVAAVLVALAARAVHVVVLGLWALREPDETFDAAVTAWDGAPYRDIAVNGYPRYLPEDPVTGEALQSPIAFFPLFPLLTEPFLAVGLPFVAVAVVLNSVLAAVAAGGIAVLVERWTGDRRTALLVSVLWSLFPLSFLLNVAYSEATFVVLVVAVLLALSGREARLLTAGALSSVAGLTRPTALVLVVCVAAVAWRERRLLTPRALAAVGLGLAGTATFHLFLWRATGEPDAWFRTEAEAWELSTDGGVSTARTALRAFLDPGAEPHLTGVAVGVVVALVLLGALLLLRPPLEVAVLSVGLIGLALATDGTFPSIPRYVMAAFPVLLPVAVGLRRLPRPAVGPAVTLVLAGLLVASSVLALYYSYNDRWWP